MSIVAGVDFGTLSVRVTLLDKTRGQLATASESYPLKRSNRDPNLATQSHHDQMAALVRAVNEALERGGIAGDQIEALALDTTGSSILPVDANMQPLDDYALWCDHRAILEAEQITELARRSGLEAIKWCGGVYSCEWGWAKLLYWLRHNPEKREFFASSFEHCDMVAATLCGVKNPKDVKRSACAMGHKWMWNERWGGLPAQEFLSALDPLLDGIRERLSSSVQTSEHLAGNLSAEWAEPLGLRAGIPIPVGALDAHWDAIGSGCREGDIVNVIGTSTCIIAMGKGTRLIPGISGVVPGSVHPAYTGLEAGMSAVGDLFQSIATRAKTDLRELSETLKDYKPGQTGLLRVPWDAGDRSILVNPDLGGITMGWNLMHTAADEFFAAIEGTAFITRIILERLSECDVPVLRVINGGGIPQHNPMLNQIYADVIGKPVLVPKTPPTSLGAGIFALLAAGAVANIEEAQERLCPLYTTYLPNADHVRVYEDLYALFRSLYFAFGKKESVGTDLGHILPRLREIAAQSRIQ